jgi:hypothetical protein
VEQRAPHCANPSDAMATAPVEPINWWRMYTGSFGCYWWVEDVHDCLFSCGLDLALYGYCIDSIKTLW